MSASPPRPFSELARGPAQAQELDIRSEFTEDQRFLAHVRVAMVGDM